MWNDELKTLDYFLCLPNYDLRYLGPVWDQFSPNCPNVPNTLKQVKLEPQMAFKMTSLE